MKISRFQSGFTLVEMIVSLAIFAVVVTVSVGALLMLVGTNQRLQSEQAIMTSLSFALDSMTREIRTGSAYYCFGSLSSNALTETGDLNVILTNSSVNPPQPMVNDCPRGNDTNLTYHGLAFLEGGGSISGTGPVTPQPASSGRIAYFFDQTAHTIYRRVGSGEKQSIIANDLHIVDVQFFVSGSNSLQMGGIGASVQPTVTIYIRAAENPDGSGKQFDVQTTVAQRTLDV